MNCFFHLKAVGLACLLTTIIPLQPQAQKTVSFDVAMVRNLTHRLNGLNLSCFYHFSEKLTGGVEMNRFFPVAKGGEGKSVRVSAWDFDLNLHYLIRLGQRFAVYPLSGISHTSELESDDGTGEKNYQRFWSFNTGAGLLVSVGRWIPHAEYMLTWGKQNQRFLLVGVSYEIGWGRNEKE